MQAIKEQIKRGKEIIGRLRAIGRDTKLLEERVKALEVKLKENQKEEPKQTQNSILSLEQILGLRLSELSRRNIALRIYSEVLGCDIWLCGTEQMAAQVKEDDPEATIYTVDETRKLIRLNPASEDIKCIHSGKSVFPGSTIIEGKEKEDIPKSETKHIQKTTSREGRARAGISGIARQVSGVDKN